MLFNLDPNPISILQQISLGVKEAIGRMEIFLNKSTQLPISRVKRQNQSLPDGQGGLSDKDQGG
ncbi:MAG: hypothetical protein CMH52_04650 [Myxococcales bacterium]|nr:hypothetical protein [Myxococcales bacterium]